MTISSILNGIESESEAKNFNPSDFNLLDFNQSDFNLSDIKFSTFKRKLLLIFITYFRYSFHYFFKAHDSGA